MAQSKRQEFRVEGLNEPISHYTDAVRWGDTLYISGLAPLDRDGRLVGGTDAAAQTRQILENMTLILAAAGAGFADVLRVIKTNSSRWIHQTFPNEYDFAWQSGYAAFAVSQSNVEVVRHYIAHQKDHHRTMTFKDEFIASLKKHNIPYEDKYVFEEEFVA